MGEGRNRTRWKGGETASCVDKGVGFVLVVKGSGQVCEQLNTLVVVRKNRIVGRVCCSRASILIFKGLSLGAEDGL